MGHIVEFPLQSSEHDVFTHEDLERIYVIWQQLHRREGQLPVLHVLAPRHLGRWMAWSGIIEDANQDPQAMPHVQPRWRLAGSALCRIAGKELTGAEGFAGWPHFERATLNRMLQQTLQGSLVFLARLRVQEAPGFDGADMEMLSLPMLDESRNRVVALVLFRPSFDPDMVMPVSFSAMRLMSLRTLQGFDAMPPAERQGMHAKVLRLFDGQQKAS